MRFSGSMICILVFFSFVRSFALAFLLVLLGFEFLRGLLLCCFLLEDYALVDAYTWMEWMMRIIGGEFRGCRKKQKGRD